MSSENLQAELQQLSNEMRQFDEYGKQLQVEIETLQSFLIELTRSKKTLEGLKEEKKVEETLVQLGSGVMMRVKPLNTKEVYFNVGAGVIVARKVDDAIAEISTRIQQGEKNQSEKIDQLNQVVERIGMLERKAQTIYQQIQGPSKAQYDPDLVS
ncbi:MAG: prefoldin subunit alpha [Asgard group archaeon]|nr:prefoldin subunit alpha [Asgard group archaeon]